MKTKKLVFAALFAAITCIATLIKVPLALTGYINLGDCIVLLCGWMLGPVYGAAAAGIGSALADIFAGYANYAPVTLLIKAAMALTAYFIVGKARRFSSAPLRRILGGAVAEIIMVGGYFLAECFIFSYGIGAAASIPFNAIQGIAGIAGAVPLFMTLKRIKTE